MGFSGRSNPFLFYHNCLIMLKEAAISDFKQLIKRPLLIGLLLLPVLLTAILKITYPLISNKIELLFRLAPDKLFTLCVITIISSIPIVTGFTLSAFSSSTNKYSEVYHDNLIIFTSNSLFSFFVTFFLVVLSTLIADPVSSEGWLRIIFVALLFSIFSIYVLLILNRYLNKVKHLNIYILCAFFLICVPFGMISPKPWNYIGFMSPLYWINWAWIFPNRTESILAGMFAIISTGGAISPLVFILYRKKKL